MPTRKQRRRRAKERRHDWEEVYIDEEGREIPAEEAELAAPSANGKREARAERGGRGARKRPAQRRGGREVQPPSWRRVLKRGAIFAPLMFLFIYWTGREEASVLQLVLTTMWLLLIFLPFSYVIDSTMYRIWKRRMAKLEGGSAAAKRR